MGQSTGELDDLRSLTHLIEWMNAQPRRPGDTFTKWRHENARAQLELLGLRFIQRRRGTKLYFRISDLQDVAPMLARAYLGPTDEGAGAEADA